MQNQLHRLTGTTTERWAAIDCLVSRWCGVGSPLPSCQLEISEIETLVKMRLSESVSHWLRLTEQLTTAQRSPLRDGRNIEVLANERLLAVQVQAEGDIYWVIRFSELSDDDPHVHAMCLDFEAESFSLVDCGLAPSVPLTEFAVIYLSSYFQFSSGFQLNLERSVLPTLEDTLDHVCLGSTFIADGPGWIATAHTQQAITGAGPGLRVLFLTESARQHAPNALLQLELTAHTRMRGNTMRFAISEA